MQRVHIGIGDAGLRPAICKAAGKPGTPERSPANLDWWNLVKAPQRGERVILYLKKPVKAFVATCTVASGLVPCPDQESEFKDKPCFLVSDLSLLPNGDVEFGRILKEFKEFNDWPLAQILVQTSRCLSTENTTPEQLRRFLRVLGLDESFGTSTGTNTDDVLGGVQINGAVEGALEGIIREVTSLRRASSKALHDEVLRDADGECAACKVDFSKVLSGRGKRVLHVHHRKQRALQDGPVFTTKADLAVVCANCHMLLHLDPENPMPVEELRRLLKEDEAGR